MDNNEQLNVVKHVKSMTECCVMFSQGMNVENFADTSGPWFHGRLAKTICY